LVDSLIRHQAFLQGYAKSAALAVNDAMAEAEQELKNFIGAQFIANDVERQTSKQLRALESALKNLRASAWAAARDKLIDYVTELVQYEPEFLRGAVSSIQSLISWVQPEIDTLRALVDKTLVVGRTIAETFQSLYQAEVPKLIAQTRIGYLSKALGGTVMRAMRPILNVVTPVVDTIAASAISAVAQAARALTAEANPETFADKEIWVSVLDGHTTNECRKLNGQTFVVGEGPIPGFHYRCRSSREPLLRESDPPAPIENFTSWLETQSEKFRKWLRGDPKQFTKSSVPSVTLQEVQALDRDAA
jgi:hypothetical protein